MAAPKRNSNTGPSTAEVEALLRARQIQPTAQRLAVCSHMLNNSNHPTVEEVKTWLDGNSPKMSLATVYNTLNILVEAGLVKAIRFPHLDKVAFDNNTATHHHFVDDETGEIVDIPAKALTIRPRIGSRFNIDSVEVTLRGTRNATRNGTAPPRS